MPRHENSRSKLERAVIDYGQALAKGIDRIVTKEKKSGATEADDGEGVVTDGPDKPEKWQEEPYKSFMASVSGGFDRLSEEIGQLRELLHLQDKKSDKTSAEQKEINKKTAADLKSVGRRQEAFDERQNLADERQNSADGERNILLGGLIKYRWLIPIVAALIGVVGSAMFNPNTKDFLIVTLPDAFDNVVRSVTKFSADFLDADAQIRIATPDKADSGQGKYLLSCWREPAGGVVPLFSIQIMDNGYIVSKAWTPKFATIAGQSRPIMNLIEERSPTGFLNIPDFRRLAGKVRIFGATETSGKKRCVYYANTKDLTKTAGAYGQNKKNVDKYFYPFRTK